MVEGNVRPNRNEAAPRIVPLPEEIDLENAEDVGVSLTTALSSGADIVIGDMTNTTFCDSASVRTLVNAHRQAGLTATELRMAVMPAGHVRRILEIMGLTNLFWVYSRLADALAQPAG
jgi:anti-anti-sigma factor